MDYNKKTKEELVELAKERKFGDLSVMKKAAIIEMLKNADAVIEAEQPEEKEVEVTAAEGDVTEAAEKTPKQKQPTKRRASGAMARTVGETLTINSDDRFKKVETELEKEDRELALAQMDHSYSLSGEVIKITAPKKMNYGGSTKLVISAVVKYKKRKIQIPAQLFLEQYDDIDDGDILEYMQKRIGSEVDFCVLQSEETAAGTEYFGSRLYAMENKRRKFWYGKKTNGSMVIENGSRVEARVIVVAQKLIIVDVFGVEVRIPNNDLAYEYLDDARTVFATGDRVDVIVDNIERADTAAAAKDEHYPISCTASVKACFNDPREIYFCEYEPGDSCKGVVTQIKDNADKVIFFVNVAGEIDVYCWLKQGITMLPEVGDTVSIRIARKYEEKKRFTGQITHVIRAR